MTYCHLACFRYLWLFKMIFDCLWVVVVVFEVVVEFFDVVLGGSRLL